MNQFRYIDRSVNLRKLLVIYLWGKCFSEHENRSGSTESIVDSSSTRFRNRGEEFEHDREESSNLSKSIKKTTKWSFAEETRLVGRVLVNQYPFGMKLASAKGYYDAGVRRFVRERWRNGIKQYTFRRKQRFMTSCYEYYDGVCITNVICFS